MGIREEILNDVRRQGAEEKQKELEQKMDSERRNIILNLHKKGFSNTEIAEIIGIPVEEVEHLQL